MDPENGEPLIFTPVKEVEDNSEMQQLDPALVRKSTAKQIEILLSALRRERNRAAELSVQMEVLMKQYRTQITKNT